MIGIIRRIDDLGRISLPKEFRTYLGIKHQEPVEICLEEDCIVIKPRKSDVKEK